MRTPAGAAGWHHRGVGDGLSFIFWYRELCCVIELRAGYQVRACHDVLTDGRYRRLGASFPSALVPPAALEGAGRVIGNALALRGVIGHATVHFTAFEVCAPGEIERQAQASQANSNDRRFQRLQAIPPLPAAKQCGCGRRTWRCARERSASPSDAHC